MQKKPAVIPTCRIGQVTWRVYPLKVIRMQQKFGANKYINEIIDEYIKKQRTKVRPLRNAWGDTYRRGEAVG